MITTLVILQVVGNLAVELAFPSCSLKRLWDWDVILNNKLLANLECGEAGRVACGEWFVSGSRAEGLALEDGWGHGKVDTDYMKLYGGNLRVVMPSEDGPPLDDACFVLRTSGCPPAHARVEGVGEADQLYRKLENTRVYAAYSQTIRPENIMQCFELQRDKIWLSSYGILRALHYSDTSDRFGSRSISGPAGQYVGNDDLAGNPLAGIMLDYVVTLICSGPLPTIQSYLDRSRSPQWPRQETMARMRNMPAMLVCTGHRFSLRPDLEFRLSWSFLELLLATDMPDWIKQAHCAFKLIVKRGLAKQREVQQDSAVNRNGDDDKIKSKRWFTALMRVLKQRTDSDSDCLIDNEECEDLFKEREMRVFQGRAGSEAEEVGLTCMDDDTREDDGSDDVLIHKMLLTALKGYQAGDHFGRSKLGSYHMKTVLLYTLEEHPPSAMDSSSPFDFMLLLLRKLQFHLQKGTLPHYFDPQCDLFECIDKEELHGAMSVVETILSDPVSAIIHSPEHPEELYGADSGGITPDELNKSLQDLMYSVSSPDFSTNKKKMRRILKYLDTYRWSKYNQVLAEDAKFRVTTRLAYSRLQTRIC